MGSGNQGYQERIWDIKDRMGRGCSHTNESEVCGAGLEFFGEVGGGWETYRYDENRMSEEY